MATLNLPRTINKETGGKEYLTLVRDAVIRSIQEEILFKNLKYIVDILKSDLPTTESLAHAQQQAYGFITAHIHATGRLYRGCNFKTTEERDAFISMIESQGLSVPNSTKDHQCYNGIPLSALFCLSSQFAKIGEAGVVFEIDATKIRYRPVDYVNGEECPINIPEAEVRSWLVPASAIIASHIQYNFSNLRDALRE
ncbi:MAG: hypothetical protein ACYCO0_05010 [Candidatus Micrarchaeaceae archaeon]